MGSKIIAKTKYDEQNWLEWSTDFWGEEIKKIPEIKNYFSSPNDIQVRLLDKNNKYLADAICHYGSYGVENGEWEVMMNKPPKSWGDTVKGNLTWVEVMKYFNLAIKQRYS